MRLLSSTKWPYDPGRSDRHPDREEQNSPAERYTDFGGYIPDILGAITRENRYTLLRNSALVEYGGDGLDLD
jgi:hypothetical protein